MHTSCPFRFPESGTLSYAQVLRVPNRCFQTASGILLPDSEYVSNNENDEETVILDENNVTGMN